MKMRCSKIVTWQPIDLQNKILGGLLWQPGEKSDVSVAEALFNARGKSCLQLHEKNFNKVDIKSTFVFRGRFLGFYKIGHVETLLCS